MNWFKRIYLPLLPTIALYGFAAGALWKADYPFPAILFAVAGIGTIGFLIGLSIGKLGPKGQRRRS